MCCLRKYFLVLCIILVTVYTCPFYCTLYVVCLGLSCRFVAYELGGEGTSKLLKVLIVDGRAKCPIVKASVVAAPETCLEQLFLSLSA